MADNELTLHIKTVFDGAEKLSKQIADSIPTSGMNKKRVAATSQKLAGTDAQLSQLESIWQQMDPQEALASLRKILVSYEKINFGMAKYSAEAQKEIQDLTDQIESKQEELDNLARKDKINRGKLGSVRYNRDENDNIVGAKSLTLGSTEIKAGLPDVLKGTDLDVDKGTRAALLNAQKDDSLTDEQKKAAEAYAKDVQAEEAILLKQLNDEIQLREKLRQEIASLEAQKAKKVENAATPSDTFSEDNAVNTGTAEKLITDTNDVADAAKKAAGEEKDLGEETSKTEQKQKKQDNTIAKAVKSFFGYQQVIRALRTVINYTVKTITDLDKALTDQSIVSGLTRQQTWQLVSSYESLAKQTGFTTTEIAQTASKFLQQGKTVKETLELTEAAAKSARVAGISASQAVDYLTTALNGFGMKADQALEVSDKFAALAASSATSYDELAVALSKVASQASLAGMSMDYTLALLAKGVETTRESAESIGTALKTVIARMREITDYSATLEDGTNINNVEKQLKTVGIALRSSNGDLRSTQDVLDELGKKWDTLSTNQQAAIAKALAGTRQQSRLISMLNDYDRTLELMEISENSLGATNAQQAKYMQSMEAAANKVKTAFQGLVTTLTNSDVIIKIVNTFADVISGLQGFVGWLKKSNLEVAAIIGVLLLLTPILITQGIVFATNAMQKAADTKESLKNLLAEYLSAKAKLASAKASGTEAVAEGASAVAKGANTVATNAGTAATLSFAAAQKVLSFAIKAVPIVGWAIAIVSAIAAIVTLVVVLNDWRTNAQKLTDDVANLTVEIYSLKKEASDMKSVTDSWEKLDNKIVKTKQDLEDMQTAREKAISLLQQKDSEKYKNVDSWTTADLMAELSKIQAEDKQKTALDEAKILEDARNSDFDWSNSSNEKNVRGALNYSGSDWITDNSGYDTAGKTAAKEFYTNYISSLKGAQLADPSNSAENIFKNFTLKDIEALKQMSDDSLTLKERVTAYNQVLAALPESAKATFKQANSEIANIADTFKEKTYELLDYYSVSTDSLNDLNQAMIDIGGKQFATNMEDVLNQTAEWLQEGHSAGDLADYLAKKYNLTAEAAKKLAEETTKTLSGGTTVQSITQQQSQVESEVKTIRDTQSKWGSMSASERQDFMSSHSGFFLDENGNFSQEKYDNFASGKDITADLEKYYSKDIQALKNKYTWAYNEAVAKGDTVAAAEAADALKNIDSVLQESLDDIVKKQESQLSTYKTFLKQQQTDLIDSLNARKAAYQDYFDTINSAYDEQNFEQEETRLQQQIVKLSGGTDATSQNKIIELQKSLKTLQDNHSETARKNAQEAVLNNIDAEIDKVNQYYEDALNNDQTMIDLLNEWLTSGKSRDEYSAYLKEQGYSPAKYEQAMKSFDHLYADGKVAGEWMNNSEATEDNTNALKESNSTLKMIALANAMSIAGNMNLGTTAAPEIKTDKSGNTFIEFNGKTFALDENSSENLQQFMLELMKTSKTVPTVKG